MLSDKEPAGGFCRLTCQLFSTRFFPPVASRLIYLSRMRKSAAHSNTNMAFLSSSHSLSLGDSSSVAFGRGFDFDVSVMFRYSAPAISRGNMMETTSPSSGKSKIYFAQQTTTDRKSVGHVPSESVAKDGSSLSMSRAALSLAGFQVTTIGRFWEPPRISLHSLLEYQDKGAPLEFARADPAVLEKSTPMFIAEHAPHPNAAMLFADWLTSLEGQQAYYDISRRLVPHPGVRSRLADAIKTLNVVFTPAEIAVHGNEANKIFQDIFWK